MKVALRPTQHRRGEVTATQITRNFEILIVKRSACVFIFVLFFASHAIGCNLGAIWLGWNMLKIEMEIGNGIWLFILYLLQADTISCLGCFQ